LEGYGLLGAGRARATFSARDLSKGFRSFRNLNAP
jgi:hypothetical protein